MKKIWLLLMFVSSLALGQDQVYDVFKVNEIKLEFEDGNWDEILASNKDQGNEERLMGTLYFNGIRYDSVGVRYKGNSSYKSFRKSENTKLPFNIKLNYGIRGQSLLSGCNTIKLSNLFRDPSFVREALSYEIVRNYMPAPRAAFSKVYVNGAYLGLYNNVESIDKPFLKEHFGDSKGIFIKCDPDWHFPDLPDCKISDKSSLQYLGKDSTCYMKYYEFKSDHEWAKLIELMLILNLKTGELEEIFNVDRALWMLAFNNVFVNLDSYTGRLCHNYYLYEDKAGRFNTLIWDLNLSFGGFNWDGISGHPLKASDMMELNPYLHLNNNKRPMISKLLTNKLYRRIYTAHVRTILDEFVFNGKYLERAKEIQGFIAQYVQSDSNKIYPYDSFEYNLTNTTVAGRTKIIGLQQLMDGRAEYFRQNSVINRTAPIIKEQDFRIDGDSIFFDVIIRDGDQVKFCYKLDKHGPFERVNMRYWSDFTEKGVLFKHFKYTIEKEDDVRYFLLAMNEKAATLDPPRAEYEFHRIKLKKKK